MIAQQRLEQFRALRMSEDKNLPTDTRDRASKLVTILQPSIDALEWAVTAATSAAHSTV